MATIRAIAATCDAICRVLHTNAQADQQTLGIPLQFKILEPDDLDLASSFTGVTVLLYRVLPNLTHRTPAGRLSVNGTRRRTQLPLDLHLLLTVWARQRTTENIIVAWMMRTLEDYPVLPASVLNIGHAGTFSAGETVEVVSGETPGDEILHLWEVLGAKNYHVTIPYVARNVYIESDREVSLGEPVQVRDLDMGISPGHAVAAGQWTVEP